MSNPEKTRRPYTSPWGRPQSCHTIAPGIVEITTPGHGGIGIGPERNASVHPAWRAKPDHAGWSWYEEDCEWSIVAITFPELERFAAHLDCARQTARDCWPDEYTRATGETLTPAESRVLRERAARGDRCEPQG